MIGAQGNPHDPDKRWPRIPERIPVGPKTYSRKTVLIAGGVGVAGAILGSKLAGVGPLASSPAGTSGAFMCVSDTYNLDSGYWAYTAALETKLGRGFAGFRMNGGFTGASADFAEMRKAYDAGRHWTYCNAKPAGPVTGYWKSVAAGKYDAAFRTFIQTVQSDARWTAARPFHYSFHHEQSVVSEGGGTAAGTAADYAAAWNHVAGLIDQAGAHVSQGGNMLRCWTPHWLQVCRDHSLGGTGTASSGVAALLASKILAGGLDVSKLDLVGEDAYVTTSQTFSAASQWTPLHNLGMKVGRPIFTGETGVAGTDAKVSAYLSQLLGLIGQWGAGTGPGEVTAICWTSRIAKRGTQTFDYRMDATPTRLAAFKSFVSSPLLAATL